MVFSGLLILFLMLSELAGASYSFPTCRTEEKNGGILAGAIAFQNDRAPLIAKPAVFASSAIPNPVSGNLKVLVIPVVFSDLLNITDIETSLSVKTTSLASYYAEISYGSVTLNIETLSNWTALPHTLKYYGNDNGTDIDVNWFAFVTDSLNAADPSVDFRNYGYVLLVHAGNDQASSGVASDLWSSAYVGKQAFPNDGGVNLGLAVLSEMDPYGVFAHEFGHTIGLPDLYDYSSQNQAFVRVWSLMDYGAWLMPPSSLMAPEKMWLNWIPPANTTVVNAGQILNVTLTKLETPGNVLAVKIPVNDTYYALEYRTEVLTDSALPNEGVIVSYVNESLHSGQGIIRIKSADPSSQTLYDAPFTSGQRFVDSNNQVAVKVLSLDSDKASIRVQKGFADLFAEKIQFVGDILQGQNISFDVYVKNVGVTASDPCYVSLNVNGTIFAVKELPMIANGSETVLEFGPWQARPGLSQIQANVDVNNDVVENNKTNNAASAILDVPAHYVSIDRAVVSKQRVDVNSTQQVSFHARWNDNVSDIAGGTLFVNGSAFMTNSTGWVTLDVTSPEVANVSWSISGVDVQGFQVYGQDVPSPWIVWDCLQAYDFGVSNLRCDINSIQTIWVRTRYAYEGDAFDNSDGQLWIDGRPADWNPQNSDWTLNVTQNTVGQSNYTVPTGFQDDLFGLTFMIGQRELLIVWDTVNLTVALRNPRINVGSSVSFEVNGTYVFDSTMWNGTVVFNDTLMKNEVGRFSYSIVSISDSLYGLTTFSSNVASVIFDRLVLNASVSNGRINVGEEAKVVVTGVYQYDGAIWNGDFTLNDSVVKNEVGRFGFMVTSLTDPNYNLTAFNSNSFSVVWDRVDLALSSSQERVKVGLKAPVTWTGQYEFDGAVFEGNVTLNEDVVKITIGLVNYTAVGISDSLYNLTAFRTNEVSVVFDDLNCTVSTVTSSIGRTKIEINVRYVSDGKPVTGATVTVGDRQLDEIGNGNYVAEIAEWKPYATYRINVEKLSLTKNLETTVLLTANTVFISLIAFVIVLIIIVLMIYRKTHRFQG